MLNRFRSVLYGNGNDNNQTTHVDEYDDQVLGKRIRNVIKRSTSFQEILSRVQTNDIEVRDDSIVNIKLKFDSAVFSERELRDGDRASRRFLIRDVNKDPRFKYPVQELIKEPKFHYARPSFLQLKTEDEILVSADHQIRPIIVPRDSAKLPWRSGYAECINAGKSARNEDQAACYHDLIVEKSSIVHYNNDCSSLKTENQIPWFYFGIFDGHAGSAVAVAASMQLHNIISDKLNQISEILIELYSRDLGYADECQENKLTSFQSNLKAQDDLDKQNETETIERSKILPRDEASTTDDHNNKSLGTIHESSSEIDGNPSDGKILPTLKQIHESNISSSQLDAGYIESSLTGMIDVLRNNITIDKLIKGCLESAFWEMDQLIAKDKILYSMNGGCTAIVSLFIFGKLYVCNAGDSRSIVYKDNQVIPMSFDFTPISEKERILKLGSQRPEYLGSHFTHLEFLRRPTRNDLGKQMLYKDAYMTGWTMKTITYDDLKFPLVWGEGKRSRVLATIGVTRGFGDHELRAQYGSVLIKPFLTPEPEVKILSLEDDDNITAEDVLIMATDGLWDVTSNEEAARIVKNSFDLFPDKEESRSKYRYITAAQDLVIHSRGNANSNNIWRTDQDKLASLDDIAVFVIPLKQYRDEFIEWKQKQIQANKLRGTSRES